MWSSDVLVAVMPSKTFGCRGNRGVSVLSTDLCCSESVDVKRVMAVERLIASANQSEWLCS